MISISIEWQREVSFPVFMWGERCVSILKRWPNGFDRSTVWAMPLMESHLLVSGPRARTIGMLRNLGAALLALLQNVIASESAMTF